VIRGIYAAARAEIGDGNARVEIKIPRKTLTAVQVRF